jgi:hypothetical protein
VNGAGCSDGTKAKYLEFIMAQTLLSTAATTKPAKAVGAADEDVSAGFSAVYAYIRRTRVSWISPLDVIWGSRMKSILPTFTWADCIIDRDDDRDFGPYHVNPSQRRLMLVEEIRRTKVGAEPTPSRGWTTIRRGSLEARIWCAPGAEIFFAEGKVRRFVFPVSGEREVIPKGFEQTLLLVLNGSAFVFDGDVFILPHGRFGSGVIRYERPNADPVTVFVGYRGHAYTYPTILSPSILRAETAGANTSRYLRYKEIEGYAGDLLRQGYFRYREDALQDLQVRGILQHHKVIGATDILDLTYDVERARAYALNSGDSSGNCDDYAFIYQIVIRVLGGTRKPLPCTFRGRPVKLLPWNICPLSMVSELAEGDRGFGVSHLGPIDRDNYGMVLNVTTWRYHPRVALDGWSDLLIDRTTMGISAVSAISQLETASPFMVPPEPMWLEDLLGDVKHRVANRFGNTLAYIRSGPRQHLEPRPE